MFNQTLNPNIFFKYQLRIFPNYIFITILLFISLFFLQNTEAEEENFSSTITINSEWYTNNDSLFVWNVTGKNITEIEFYYSYEKYEENHSNWSFYQNISVTEENQTGVFSFNFPKGFGFYFLESNAINSSGESEFGCHMCNWSGDLIKFDDITPDSSTSLDSGFYPTNTSIKIPWAATDNLMLKSVQLEYRFYDNSLSDPGNWLNFGVKNAEGLSDNGNFTNFVFLNGEGRYDFRLIARDHAGNEEINTLDTFVVFDGTPAQVNYTNNLDYWVQGNTMISWQVSDNYELYSVEMRYSYRSDNSSDFGDWISFQTNILTGIENEGSFNFDFDEGQGVYNFWIIGNDEAGNSNQALDSSSGQLSLGYDIEEPTGVMIYDGDFWQNLEASIQYSSQDNIDVEQVDLYYRFKPDNFSSYSSYYFIEAFKTSEGITANGIMKAEALNGSGLYQFRIMVEDSAGNKWTSSNSNFLVGFDIELPEIYITKITIESSYVFYNSDLNILYYNSNNTVKDDEIGIAGYCADYTSNINEGTTSFESSFYDFGDIPKGSMWSTEFTFAPFTTGNQTLTINVLDDANNQGSLTILIVDDKTPPVTSIALIIEGEAVDQTENYTISPQTKYSLSSYDSASGVNMIEYRFDSQEWKTYDEPFEVDPKTKKIDYRAIDKVGNQNNISSLEVELLNIIPTSIIHSPSSSITVEEGQNIFFNGSGSDIDGDIFEYKWISDKDGLISNASNFNISTLSPGTHIIEFTVMDDQGVWSEAVSVKVIVSDDLNLMYLFLILLLAASVIGYNIYFSKPIERTTSESSNVPEFTKVQKVVDAEEILECNNCNLEISSTAMYCNSCGSSTDPNTFDEFIKCISCNEEILINKKFCKNCGNKVSNE